MPETSVIKYHLNLSFEIQGVVEKADVVGAIFGQTEGLFGPEMNLQELQKTWKIGRIEINLTSRDDKTDGNVVIPLSTDMSTAALIAAAVESVEKVGPCLAHFKLNKIDDIRSIKRKSIVDRAKQIANTWATKSISEGEESIKDVSESVRRARITNFGKEALPAGPGVFVDDWIILVEGRADVINLLRAGYENVIAVEGTKIPESVIRLIQEKEFIAFLDGDRAGDLISKEIQQVGKVKEIIRAPTGKEVEDLTPSEIQEILQRANIFSEKAKKETVSTKTEPIKRTEPIKKAEPIKRKTPTKELGDLEKKIPKIYEEINETLEAIILDNELKEIKRVPVNELAKVIESNKESEHIIFDGIITQRLIDSAVNQNVKTIIAHRIADINKVSKELSLFTFSDLGL